MEPSSNLGPLPEEISEEQEHQHRHSEQQQSAFSSLPHRPALQLKARPKSTNLWIGQPILTEKMMFAFLAQMMSFMYIQPDQKGQLFFCLHGGGYSGAPCSCFCRHCFATAVVLIVRLSFALSASKIKERARVVALGLRGHGKSSTENDIDLSIETMSDDVLSVVKTMYGDSPPAIVLVGHSMGGSVAVHVAAKRALACLAGLVVVDVVEGTAMASLIHMQKILSNRMQHFSSIEKAIEWSVKGGTLRNVESARVSVPTTLKYDESKNCYTYRAQLEETEQYWRGWYEGLSEKFLSSPVPKLLLLAGTDRLDRTLTIGQMQGKFQMVVVRHTGHAIQEDSPDEFSTLILSFISRNRIGPHGIEIPGLRRPVEMQ